MEPVVASVPVTVAGLGHRVGRLGLLRAVVGVGSLLRWGMSWPGGILGGMQVLDIPDTDRMTRYRVGVGFLVVAAAASLVQTVAVGSVWLSPSITVGPLSTTVAMLLGCGFLVSLVLLPVGRVCVGVTPRPRSLLRAVVAVSLAGIITFTVLLVTLGYGIYVAAPIGWGVAIVYFVWSARWSGTAREVRGAGSDGTQE